MLGIAECLCVSSKLLRLRLSVHVACTLRCSILIIPVSTCLQQKEYPCRFRVPLSSEGFYIANNELDCKRNSLCNCIFVPKGGGTQAIFMCYWMNYGLTFGQ